MKTVYIVIVNWNRWEETIASLETVFRLKYERYKVIVCDNSSSDGSYDYIKAWALGSLKVGSTPVFIEDEMREPLRCITLVENDGHELCAQPLAQLSKLHANLILIQTGGNLGFAGANNVGIQYVLSHEPDADVWLLNNDTVVSGNSLTALVEKAYSDTRIGITGSKVLYYDHPNTIQVAGGGRVNPWFGRVSYLGGGLNEIEYSGGEDNKLSYIMGVSMFIKNECLLQVGLFDERYFLGWEETDYCHRAFKKGWRFAYSNDSKIWHRDSATIGVGSKISDYYGTRNSILFNRKYYTCMLPFTILFGLFGKVMVRLIRKKPERIPVLIRAYLHGIAAKDGYFGGI